MAEVVTHQTLFVGNIDHAIKRDDLECLLHELFVPYGHINEIHIRREEKVTRSIGKNKSGQKYAKPMPYMKTFAFVVFMKPECAVNAKKLHGFQFFGRELVVAFSRHYSDSVLLAEGKHPLQDKAARDKQEKELARRQKTGIAIVKKGVSSADSQNTTSKKVNVGDPSVSLLVQGLIPEFTEEIMRPLFDQFPGLEEIKHFSTQNTMKLEFTHEDHAGKCLHELQGFNLDGKVRLEITFC